MSALGVVLVVCLWLAILLIGYRELRTWRDKRTRTPDQEAWLSWAERSAAIHQFRRVK